MTPSPKALPSSKDKAPVVRALETTLGRDNTGPNEEFQLLIWCFVGCRVSLWYLAQCLVLGSSLEPLSSPQAQMRPPAPSSLQALLLVA